MKKNFLLTTLLLAPTFSSFAQGQLYTKNVFLSTDFFIIILSGVLLALALQFILTTLSVAMGITAIGNVKENYAENKADPRSDSNNDDDDGNTGVKISTAFGVWSVLTTCIALFGATALAINLSAFETVDVNITVALVIWAVFFLTIFYLETKLASSALSTFTQSLKYLLKGTTDTLTSMFSKSDQKKLESTLSHTVDKIRKTHFESDQDHIVDTIEKFFKKAENKLPSYEQLKNDILKSPKKVGPLIAPKK